MPRWIKAVARWLAITLYGVFELRGIPKIRETSGGEERRP